MSGNRSISFQEGWEMTRKGIDKLEKILEGDTSLKITYDDYMSYYTYEHERRTVMSMFFSNLIKNSIS